MMKDTMHIPEEEPLAFSLRHGKRSLLASFPGFDPERFVEAGDSDGEFMQLRDWAVDAGIALLAFLFGCGQLFLASTSVIYVDGPFREMAGLVNIVPNAYAYGALAFTTFPLVFRRVAPWPTLLIVLSCFFFSSGFMSGYALSAVGPIVAIFNLAYEFDKRHVIVAGIVTVAVMVFAPTPLPSETLATVMKTQNVVFVLASSLAGIALRMYQAYASETRRRLEEAERGREELAARRVAEERVRIARDVHDITAHSLSAVAIQAAAAERLVDLDPSSAKEAIADIRHVSKTALDEIRSMIGVLRGDEHAQTAPAEGTERIPDVVEYLKRAGLEVSCSMRGYDKDSVPAFVDMALFALAREAATNTVRHAGARSVSIVLRSTATHVSLSFSDDGVGFGEDTVSSASGHGLEGMGERIEALGGVFVIDGQNGCSLEADIPLEGKRHE